MERKPKYYLVVFAALILGFMFHLDRSANMDFNRWQDLMETIRYSGMSLSELLEDKSNLLKWINVTLPYMYSFDILLYFTSRLFKNNYVLVWISVLIDYTIIAHIAYDWRKDSKYSQMEVILSILICFAFLPVIHVCSGLRAATSACLMALAVYDYLYRDKGAIRFALFSLLSITFHPFMIFAIPLALVIKLSTKRIIFYITVLGCLFISRIADILSHSRNVFLRALATKYTTYTSEGQFRSYRFVMYGALLFSVLVIVYYLIAYKKPTEENGKGLLSFITGTRYYNNEYGDEQRLLSFITGTRYYNNEYGDKQRLFLFIASYMALLIGNSNSYEMVSRGIYLVGALAPTIMDLLFTNDNVKNGKTAEIIRLVVVTLLLYICFSWIRYYYPYFLSFI